MERLKGKTILVGKEPGQCRLLVAISGTGKTATIGSPGCVPNCVSRCKPTEGTAHCKIDIDQNGTMVLTNLKSQNVTYVNGVEIFSKKVQVSSEVALGKDHFQMPLSLVIETAKKLVPTIAPPPPSPQAQKYNIRHLEKIWNDFHDKNIEIQKRARQQALLARIPMFFTMAGGAISAIAVALNWGDEVKTLCISFTVIGIFVMIYSFFKSKNDTSIEDREKLVEDFQDHYICPKCGKYLPVTPYKLMKKQYSMRCPHAGCGAEYTE